MTSVAAPTPGRWQAPLAALLVVAAATWTLVHPELAPPDAEEHANAAFAVALSRARPDGWWELMRFPFCGGCAVDAGLGAALFAWLPAVLGVWRLVPALWLAVGAMAGFGWLRSRVGAVAAWTWVLLLVLPPPLLAPLVWRAWGNHAEGAWLAVAALAFADGSSGARRELVAGAALGAVVVFAPGLAAVLAAPVVLALGDRRGARAARLGLGLVLLPNLWWAWLAARWGTHPLHELADYLALWHPPRSVGDQVQDLVAPARVAAWLAWVAAPGWLGLLAGLGGIAAAGVAVWSRVAALRLPVVAVLGFGAAYVLSPAYATGLGEGLRTAGELRYLAPLLVLLPLLVAGSVGWCWVHGRRALALALLAPWVALGLAGRVHEGRAALDARALTEVEVPAWREAMRVTSGRDWAWAAAASCGRADSACQRLRVAAAAHEAARTDQPLPVDLVLAEDRWLAEGVFGRELPACDPTPPFTACLDETRARVTGTARQAQVLRARLLRLRSLAPPSSDLPVTLQHALALRAAEVAAGVGRPGWADGVEAWEAGPEAVRGVSFHELGLIEARTWGVLAPPPPAHWGADSVTAYVVGVRAGLEARSPSARAPAWLASMPAPSGQ
ncbi:MAG: hypothetical protein H6732_11155 [Alphaproteobacteria bacterium]|nr:hypothetical protein [Alphaproteobacteria bacterium]